VHRRARHFGTDEHVGEQVLDRLERADGPVELPTLLGVGNGELGARPGGADEERRRHHRTLELPPAHEIGIADRLTRRELLDAMDGRQRIERSGHRQRTGDLAGRH
jgi:hypothetical protein